MTIDLNNIYQGKTTPEKRLYSLFHLIDETLELYELPTNCIQADWTMFFSENAERRKFKYSSPYQITYRMDKSGSYSMQDTDKQHIERISEDICNIDFLISSVVSFNTVQSVESREILIRKFLLKETNAEISEIMFNLEPNRTIDRKIRTAKQDAIEAFGLDFFDTNGDQRNIEMVRRDRGIIRNKIRMC